MPKFEVGNMWEAFDRADHFIVCCSSTITASGLAVMNEGVAAELVQRFPEAQLPVSIGQFLISVGLHQVYGIRCTAKIGLFQDKLYHGEPVDLMCVSTSCRMLTWQAEKHPEKQFHVEMPNHEGRYWLIQSLIERCPDNVTFWSKPKGA